MTPVNDKRGCACGVYLNKKLYIFGGTVDAFSRHASISSDIYDITLNKWQSIAPMRVPRFHASAVLLRDKIPVLVFGGIGSESIDRQVCSAHTQLPAVGRGLNYCTIDCLLHVF